VAADSPGGRTGLRPGEVILDVDRRPVASADDAPRLLGDGRSGTHLLHVYGRFGVRFVMIGGRG
jgi:S1-C subfamily serine protease